MYGDPKEPDDYPVEADEMEFDLLAEREMDLMAEAINEEARKRGWI